MRIVAYSFGPVFWSTYENSSLTESKVLAWKKLSLRWGVAGSCGEHVMKPAVRLKEPDMNLLFII